MRVRKIAWPVTGFLVLPLLPLLACVGDDPEPLRPDPADGSITTDGSSATDGGSEASDGQALDANVVSTFCKEKIAAMGAANVLLCADFDDPSAPLGAWVAGVFKADAFRIARLRGGTAVLSPGSLASADGQRLVVDKPANANSTEDTGAKYIAKVLYGTPAKGLRISFDTIVTRVSPTRPVGTFWLRGRPTNDLILSGEDATNHGKPGNVSFGLISGGSHEPLFGVAALGSLQRIELVLDPDAANSSCTLSGTLNGAPLATGADGGSPTVSGSAPLDSELDLELKASSVVPDDGAAVVQYDNLLLRKLD